MKRVAEHKLQLFQRTCRLAYGWYPDIPRITPSCRNGVVQSMVWPIVSAVLKSPYTLCELSRHVRCDQRTLIRGLSDGSCTLRVMGVLSRLLGIDLSIKVKPRTAWSGGDYAAQAAKNGKP